jgi:hypothetical protein
MRWVEVEVQWLRHGQPFPMGWRLADNEGRFHDHHAKYGRMIVREILPTEQDNAQRDD